MVNWLEGNELQLDDWTQDCRVNSMQVSAQELGLFELFIVASGSFDLTDYDMVTGGMMVSLSKAFCCF